MTNNTIVAIMAISVQIIALGILFIIFKFRLKTKLPINNLQEEDEELEINPNKDFYEIFILQGFELLCCEFSCLTSELEVEQKLYPSFMKGNLNALISCILRTLARKEKGYVIIIEGNVVKFCPRSDYFANLNRISFIVAQSCGRLILKVLTDRGIDLNTMKNMFKAYDPEAYRYYARETINFIRRQREYLRKEREAEEKHIAGMERVNQILTNEKVL